jgi:4-amino-4-deoxy-L-arabinose transferase-like glycosyltransferase
MTVLLLILFFFRFIGNRFTGYAAALVLVTSQGYLDNHIARTGDHDALLILITTAIILHVWLLLNAEKPKKKEFIFIGVLFAAGVLTKSIAVFFIVPGLLVSMLLFPGSLKIFTNKGLYIALAIFIFITAGYYVTREIMQPGYLKAVWEWELLPRYANSGNRFISASFWFYFSNLVKSRFTFWIWFLLPAMIIMPFILKDQNRRFFLFITINTVLFFLVISAGSKGVWYDGPLYPLFAIIISLTIINGYSAIGNNYPRVRIPVIISLGILYTILYRSAVVKIAYSQEWPWDAETFSMSYIIRNDQCIDTLPDPLKIVFKGYNGHFLFYTEVYEYKHNSKRFELNNIRQVKEGDTILISQPEVIDSLSKQYVCNIIWSKEPVKLVRVGTR